MSSSAVEPVESEAGHSGPRIVAVDLFVVPLPKFKPFTTAYGVIADNHLFVRLQAENGTSGWGDSGHFTGSGERWETALVNGSYLAEATIGKDAYGIGALHALWARTVRGTFGYQAKSAFDMAIYDVVCRSHGMSLSDMLGGPQFDRFDVELNVPIGTREEVLGDVDRALSLGVRTLGLKAGKPSSPSIEHDVANFRAVRERFGYDFDLWIDFNQGAERHEALQAIRTLEQFRVGQVEQPVAGSDLDGMAYIAQRVDAPIVADEPIWGAASVLPVAAKRAADIIHAKLPKAGGIHGAVKLAAVCEVLNLPLTMAGLGLANYGQAALMHFLSTQPVCSRYPHKLRAGVLSYPQDVVVSVPQFDNGAFLLPRGPGFGLEIDVERLKSTSTDRRSFT
jgi:L-alanine-DL-glutamate epimerase-like enolase superfamily enzyme